MAKLTISKIGLGTWKLGGDIVSNPNNDDKKDIEAIRYSIKRGINHIDTAESYADGKSEILVGKAIEHFKRENIIIATKVKAINLSFDKLIKSCFDSLKRLNTDYIDIYYVHKQNNNVSIKETCNALNYLLEKGLIKNVGLSNVGVKTIKLFNKMLNKKIYAVQNQYNLICRESKKKGVISYCKKHNIKFISWRPISLSFPGCLDPFKKGVFPILDEIANKYKVSNAQIAAKWLLQQKNVYIIFKSNNVAHIKEIVDTKNFRLSRKDWNMLNKKFPIMFDMGCASNEFYKLS